MLDGELGRRPGAPGAAEGQQRHLLGPRGPASAGGRARLRRGPRGRLQARGGMLRSARGWELGQITTALGLRVKRECEVCFTHNIRPLK